ncbi:MAG: hypothetical protein ACLGIN_08210, partial [Candidatus Sericytochromatia bacterium]
MLAFHANLPVSLPRAVTPAATVAIAPAAPQGGSAPVAAEAPGSRLGRWAEGAWSWLKGLFTRDAEAPTGG